MIKKQEKNNELEKDKIKAKEKKPIVIPEEDAQTNFSTVNGQTISALTSGTATPNPLSRPVNTRSLFDALIKIADIQGENPNSGVVSLSSSVVDNPLTFSTLVTNNSSRLNVSQNTSLDSFFRGKTPEELNTETGSFIQPEQVDVEPEFNTEIPIPVIIDPEPQGEPMPTEPEEEFYDLPEDEEPEPPQPPPLVIEPTQPEAVILPPTQPEAPLIYEEEVQTTKPKIKEQIFIPPYKNYAFTTTLSKYTQPELEGKFDEVNNEQFAINKLLIDQLSNIGLTMPSTGITYQFLGEHKDVLSDDLIDLISYSEDLKAEEKRIQNKLIQIDQDKPSLQAGETEQLTENKKVDGGRDVLEFEDKIKGFTAKKLGQILIEYNIENEDGLPFFIYGDHVKTKLLSSKTGNFKDTQMNKKELRDYLIYAYENGADIII
jgi:hypothetical protein